MKTMTVLVSACLALGSAIGVAAYANDRPAVAATGGQPAHAPAQQRASTIEVLHAQRFDLQQPAPHRWRVGAPLYRSGWLLVLSVDARMVVPRQGLEPVLFVGAETAERVNVGAGSGHVVAIVPGDFLLTDAPIFFGSPALPEEIGQAHIDRELARAVAAGVRAPSADALAGVLAEPLRLADDAALRDQAIELVARFAPDEQSFLRAARVPRLR